MHCHQNFKFEFSVSVPHFTCLNKDYFPSWVSCQGTKQTSNREMLNTRLASGGTSYIHNEVCDLQDADWLNKCKLILCCNLYVNRVSIYTDAPNPDAVPLQQRQLLIMDHSSLTYTVYVSESWTCIRRLCTQCNQCYNSIVTTLCCTYGVKKKWFYFLPENREMQM